MRRQMKMVLCSMVLISMTASCQKTPDMEYVTNKEGYSSLIQDNAAMDNGISVSQQVQAPTERIVETLEGTNDYTSIKIDASVTVPEGTAIPVYQYGNMDMQSELMEQYAAILFDEGMVWNNYVDTYGEYNIWTKEDVYKAVERLTKDIENGETEEGYILDEMGIKMWNEKIESLQSYLEELPENHKSGTFVDYSFMSSESVLKNESGEEICKYNTEECLVGGERNGIEYELFFGKDSVNSYIQFFKKPEILCGEEFNYTVSEQPNNGEENNCRYSREEAELLCVDFLTQLGMEELKCGRTYDLIIHPPTYYLFTDAELERDMERNGYTLYFYRSYDSAMYFGNIREQEQLLFDYMDGGGWGTDVLGRYASTVAWDWETSEDAFQLSAMEEVVVFKITDEGITNVAILNPMVTEECLAENVTLISFDRVLEQAKTQLVIQYGDTGTHLSRDSYTVREIELSYARMQSPDTSGEYILVPVWNFKLGESGNTLVSINAIDGTVFNLEDGY